jgi:hypothetical protein
MITFAWSGARKSLWRLVHAALLSFWGIGALAVLATVVGSGASPGAFVLASVWAAIGGLLVFDAARGGAVRESLAVHPPHLLHARAIGPFTLRRRYDLARIVRPRIVRVSVPPLRIYRVEFDYKGLVRRFGGGMTSAEASSIVALLLQAQEHPETARGCVR